MHTQVKPTIHPHGGVLTERLVPETQRAALAAMAMALPRVAVSLRERCDLEMLAIGAYSPLQGFMGFEDYIGTVERMRLADGTLWSIPITLGVAADVAATLDLGSEVALYDEGGTLLATMTVKEKYQRDKELEARQVYRTTDAAHPGVEYIYRQGDVLLGGPVTVLQRPPTELFPELHYTPAQLRQIFAERGWRRVVAFQTRNPMHRAHEYLTKCALEVVDGLVLHPLVGETKGDDVPAPIRVKSYQVMLDHYFPKDRAILALWGASMRYGGPREAIHHALVRKNYGCTHFIVGRDHAGVGKYYGTYDAQRIFDELDPVELGIIPLFFEHTFYCKKSGEMASYKTAPASGPDDILSLSGTKVREMLVKGECPPPWFTRPEVAAVLMEGYRTAT